MPDSMLADALSPSISMTRVRRVSGGMFLPGSKESMVGADGDIDVGVWAVKTLQPPAG